MSDFDNIEFLEQAQDEANNYVCTDCEEREAIMDIAGNTAMLFDRVAGDCRVFYNESAPSIYAMLQQMLELQKQTVALLERIANNRREV